MIILQVIISVRVVESGWEPHWQGASLFNSECYILIQNEILVHLRHNPPFCAIVIQLIDCMPLRILAIDGPKISTKNWRFGGISINVIMGHLSTLSLSLVLLAALCITCQVATI